jgi:mannose-6-phosphate isomerase-like protein (cupin superfamily)
MNKPTKGPAMVFGPDDGESYWQPTPHCGYMNVTVSPRNHPSNQLALGTQIIPPGCHVRPHAHARNDEVLFVYSGTGRCVIDGKSHAIEQGSTVVLGRYVEHSIHNDGPDDLKFFWLFSPPGLEQAVEYMGRRRTPGEPPPARFERPADFARVLEKAGYATPEEIQAAKAT